MKVNIVRGLMAVGVFTIFAFAEYSTSSIAEAGRRDAKVHAVNFKGEKEKKFKTNESVYVEGKRFDPLTTVDVYVTKNRKWKMGDILNDKDISSDGVETIQTTENGKIPKTRVWGAPTEKGDYDIVVDANQDGTYNAGDAAACKSKEPGFKVRFRR